MTRFDERTRLSLTFGAPPPEPWERVDGDPQTLELPAVAVVQTARFKRPFHIVSSGSLVEGEEYAVAAITDPGPNTLTMDSLQSHGVGPAGFTVSRGLVRNGQFFDFSGLDIARQMPGHWPGLVGYLHHADERAVDEQKVFEMVSDPSWPFTEEEFEQAFGGVAGGLAPIRRGALERILNAYRALHPRDQGKALQRAAGCAALIDFGTADLKSPTCAAIFERSLRDTVAAADVTTLKQLEAAIVGDVATG